MEYGFLDSNHRVRMIKQINPLNLTTLNSPMHHHTNYTCHHRHRSVEKKPNSFYQNKAFYQKLSQRSKADLLDNDCLQAQKVSEKIQEKVSSRIMISPPKKSRRFIT